MEWTNDDRLALLSFRDIIDDDNIKIKQEIKKKLLNNRFIIHVLNNKKLEEVDAEPEDYFEINIKPYYFIPDVITDSNNFICYTTSYDELNRYNKATKYFEITFTVMCYVRDNFDIETSLPRHDLLGALILDEFNFYPFPGGRIQCISNTEKVVDSSYIIRSITFQQITDNNLVKTQNGTASLINKKVNFT